MNLETLRDIVENILDPEIPVLNLGDLGVIREMREVDGVLHVDIAPTYSGCPATRFIEGMVAECLKNEGVENLRIRTVISPPWSSEWISEEGRKKLLAYGIAPPNPQAKGRPGRPKECPRCHQDNMKKLSTFGSTPCQALWQCNECLESFSYFKCI